MFLIEENELTPNDYGSLMFGAYIDVQKNVRLIDVWKLELLAFPYQILRYFNLRPISSQWCAMTKMSQRIAGPIFLGFLEPEHRSILEGIGW